MEKRTMNTTPAWTPFLTLDLTTASSNSFSQKIDEFEKWRPTQDQRDIDLSNGWKLITPEIAEGMLMSNPLFANRRPTLATVKYYARQMLAGKWRKTGQPLLFTTTGKLLDAGHRLWACYLSGASFETFVIGDVDGEQSNLFAFIDAGKNRSAADALSTAGLNGQAKLLASVVRISAHYEGGLYTASNQKQLEKMSPSDVIEYVEARPNMSKAVHLMASDHKSANILINHRDVAAFAAYKILDLHGEDVLDQFMNELGTVDIEEGIAESDPVAALARALEKASAKKGEDKLKKHQVLGLVIRGFNHWLKGDQLKKLNLSVNERYPHFLAPQEQIQEAAE